MRVFDTVIFDLDGTLLNTLEDLTDSLNVVLETYHYRRRSTKEVRTLVGNGIGKLAARAIPGGSDNPEFKKFVKEFKAVYEERMRIKTRPYPGIEETLEQLKKMQIKMAVVSNKFDQGVKELNSLYFSSYIALAYGSMEGVPAKPSPQVLLKAMKELGSDPSSTLFVGDSDVDVKTAKNAGTACAGVTWGFQDKERLEEEGASYLIDSPGELLGILEGEE